MTDEIVVEKPAKQSRITVVDESNFKAFVDEKTGVDPEAEGKAELERVEEEKAERKAKEEAESDPTHDIPEVPKEKKGKISERFKTLADQRKAAEERAEKREAEAKTEREERLRVQEERDALKAKYEPPKPDIITAEPQPNQFIDATEYGKALKEWTADNTRRELAAEQQKAADEKSAAEIRKNWDTRLTKTKEKYADYADVVGASDVKVSDQVRDAIMESDVGPEILYYFGNPENRDEVDKLGEMTVGNALRALGRIEAKLIGDKPGTGKTTVAEISKAPAPITPIKNGTAAVGILRGSDEVPPNMNYDEWKKRYLAGKIH